MVSIGARFHHQVMLAVDPQFREGHHEAITRTTGRLLEEMVELCLASGMTTGDVFARIADCLTKEAAKVKLFPSELEARQDPAEMLVELGDCRILLEYVRFLASQQYGAYFEKKSLDAQVESKLFDLEACAQRGELTVVNYCLYKKMQW